MRNEKFDSLLNRSIPLLVPKLLGHIELEQVGGIENLAGRKHVEYGGEDHLCNGDNGPFLTTAFGNTLVLNAVISELLAFCGGVSRLHESGL